MFFQMHKGMLQTTLLGQAMVAHIFSPLIISFHPVVCDSVVHGNPDLCVSCCKVVAENPKCKNCGPCCSKSRKKCKAHMGCSRCDTGFNDDFCRHRCCSKCCVDDEFCLHMKCTMKVRICICYGLSNFLIFYKSCNSAKTKYCSDAKCKNHCSDKCCPSHGNVNLCAKGKCESMRDAGCSYCNVHCSLRLRCHIHCLKCKDCQKDLKDKDYSCVFGR